jgi:3-methyladenine DNA glycosylase AlkD
MPSSAKHTTVQSALAQLKRASSKRYRDGLTRYGIVAPKAFGVPMGKIQAIARRIGRNHRLAHALWRSGWYEARMLASYVAEPARVTPAEMDRWCRDFDNWAICDTVCFVLYDKTPYAFRKIAQWSARRAEFEKRAAFALLASVALHDKRAPDAPFKQSLKLIEAASTDDRNFVKKGVNWALRSVGRRPSLKKDAIAMARRLAASSNATARWIGKDALRAL